MAGLCAAKTAIEAGARVLVLEKAYRSGGTTRLSDGVFNACDPQRQYPLDIHDSPERHFQDVMEQGRGKVIRICFKLTHMAHRKRLVG